MLRNKFKRHAHQFVTLEGLNVLNVLSVENVFIKNNSSEDINLDLTQIHRVKELKG